MTASCTRRATTALAALVVLPGCVTGHLLDAARRRERPLAIEAAAVDGERLVVAYTALVTDDLGAPLARRPRRAAIALAELTPGRAAEAIRVEPLEDDASIAGHSMPVCAAPGPAASGVGLLVETAPDGRPLRLWLLAADGPYTAPANVLQRTTTTPWAWPLVPVTLAVDAVVDPVLLFFAPAVILLGD